MTVPCFLGSRQYVNNNGTVTAYSTVGNVLNQYDTVGSAAYDYDDNGNLIDDDTYTYEYDPENRLLEIYEDTTLIVTYGYDALGRRISKTIYSPSTLTTQYCYDGDQVIAVYEGGNLSRKFIYGPGIDEPICMIVPGSSEVTYFYHQDALGSVVALSKFDSGLGYAQFVEKYSYSVFGETTVTQGGTSGNPYRFTGREYEPETGLYYYRARFYKPEIGRFLQTDPIGYADSMNLYQYCGNNPINFIDSFGLKWQYRGNTKLIKETVDKMRKISDRFDESYKILEESEVIYTIQTTDGVDWYNPDPSSKTVYWNPQSAAKHPWGTNSPAFCLAHEVEHPRASAKNYISSEAYDGKIQKETGFYGPQDKYIITEIEPILAQQFGEDLRKRQDGGSMYNSKCPMSREKYTKPGVLSRFFRWLFN